MVKALNVRLFISGALVPDGVVVCDKGQSHYLLHVMRLNEGDCIKVFNGRDGEWSARLERASKKEVQLVAVNQLREQVFGPDLIYLFAPLKRARLDYMVQKATELGACRLRPVITAHAQVERVNLERMRANAIEAAEQCNLLFVPEVEEPVKLGQLLADWDGERALIFCDEGKELASPIETLRGLNATKFALLIGPEGGFSDEERRLLASQRFVTPLSLGPRIMRADTAAVAGLALLNAVVGDWR